MIMVQALSARAEGVLPRDGSLSDERIIDGQSDIVLVRPPGATGIGRTTFANLLIAVVWLNSIALFLYHLTTLELLQSISNVVAISMVALSILVWLTGPRLYVTKAFGLLLIANLGLDYFLNRSHTDLIDTVKLFEIFAIFEAARQCSGTLRINSSIYGLAVLPLILVALGGSRVTVDGFSWSYFYNTNTAALFYTALLFVMSIRNPRYKIAIEIIVSALSGKVGVLLATLNATLLSGAIRLTGRTLGLAIVAIFGMTVLIISGLLDRQLNIISNFAVDVWGMGIGGIANSSFADLYKTRGGELSGYFRIIHWSEIIKYFLAGGPSYWFFGYGGGYTTSITTLKLPPHNDYLKILVEFGIFSFIAFCALVARATFGIKHKVQRALFLVLVFYFLTENLLSNFSSMALLFGFAGLVWRVPVTADGIRR